MEEEQEDNGGQSRLFVILSIGLIGLLVLGLLGIGGVFIVRQNMEQQALASRPTPTLIVRLPQASPTSAVPAAPLATNTPAPTPTNTPVVAADNDVEEAASSAGGESPSDSTTPTTTATPKPTATPVPGEGATEVPNTGFGPGESVLLAGGLILVFFVARRMRMTAA